MSRHHSLALVLLAASCGGPSSGIDDPSTVYTVRRGDLVVSVRERAEIQAAGDTRVRSMLEGRATLIDLIPEGTIVAAGDELAKLDASQIEAVRATQAISVAKAKAAYEAAAKSVEIMEKDLLALRKTAESRLQIAHLQVDKFLGEVRQTPPSEAVPDADDVAGTNRELLAKLGELLQDDALAESASRASSSRLTDRVVALLRTEANLDLEMGEMANQILQKIDEISLAVADLQMSKDTLGHSRRLLDRGFITRNELDRDEINYRRALSKVMVAWNNLQLLIKFTLPETQITIEREVENAQLGLESVIGANDARRVREVADLEASKAEYELARAQLDNYDEQIAHATITAPGPGLVVYGRWDWDEVVHEGMEVRQRQEVIILPDISSMVAEIKVHEAQIDKVAVGQPATIVVDAFPERAFTGKVTQVSSLPDPNRRNRDLKVFRVRVLFDDPNEGGSLRPGMNATVAIDVGVLGDVLQVPLPALARDGDRHFVWLASGTSVRAAQVKLGGNNTTHVEVVEGLQEGDRIYLVRPAGAQLPEDEEPASAAPDARIAAAGADED